MSHSILGEATISFQGNYGYYLHVIHILAALLIFVIILQGGNSGGAGAVFGGGNFKVYLVLVALLLFLVKQHMYSLHFL